MSGLRISPKDVARLGVKVPRQPGVRAARKPKVPTPIERDVQRKILSLIAAEFAADVEAMHVPNQAPMRGKMKNIPAYVASRKKDGVRKGWPDLGIYWPVRQATFIEVKRVGEEPDDDQLEVHARLRRLGFMVAVVHDDAEARAALIAAGVPQRGVRLPSGAVLLNRQGGKP